MHTDSFDSNKKNIMYHCLHSFEDNVIMKAEQWSIDCKFYKRDRLEKPLSRANFHMEHIKKGIVEKRMFTLFSWLVDDY